MIIVAVVLVAVLVGIIVAGSNIGGSSVGLCSELIVCHSTVYAPFPSVLVRWIFRIGLLAGIL